MADKVQALYVVMGAHVAEHALEYDEKKYGGNRMGACEEAIIHCERVLQDVMDVVRENVRSAL